ncbi:hypothetical protein [Lentilactobacillus parafarraginis]|uniref:hypothetical protein n=1 Tax=Lentilactobacillus parafarraginis TaxID=390842 RepID=UPI001CDB0679|nr:hypothetical protein [Lentilactobacillus parafarraginis]
MLGLILSYYVNYGISAAKTAALMYDIHGIKISKQTILNYAQAVAANVRPFLIIIRISFPANWWVTKLICA